MTTEIEAVTHKWGDSLAVILPREVVAKEAIHVKDKVHITIQKETDLKSLFGQWKTKKKPQQLKDESKHAWE